LLFKSSHAVPFVRKVEDFSVLKTKKDTEFVCNRSHPLWCQRQEIQIIPLYGNGLRLASCHSEL